MPSGMATSVRLPSDIDYDTVEGNLAALAKLKDASRFLNERNKLIQKGKNVRPMKTMEQSVTPKKEKGVFEGFSDDDGEDDGPPVYKNSPSLKKSSRTADPETPTKKGKGKAKQVVQLSLDEEEY